jgi:hypothetical protein
MSNLRERTVEQPGELLVHIRTIAPADEVALARFIAEHPLATPGHSRSLGAIERALGNADCSAIASVAPAWSVASQRLRVVRTKSVTGGSLVAASPIVCDKVDTRQRSAVVEGLVRQVRAHAGALGASWVRWSFPPGAGGAGATAADDTLLATLAQGASLRGVPGLVADLSGSDDELAARLPRKTRLEIRQALAKGVEAKRMEGDGAAAALLASFSEAAGTAFGEHGASRSALRAVAAAVAAEQDSLHCVLTTFQGEPASAVVVADGGQWSYYFLSFNRPIGYSERANTVALFEAMRWAQARGRRWFILGSLDFGAGKSARISEFKRRFGGRAAISPVAEWCERPSLESALRLLDLGVRRLRGR